MGFATVCAGNRQRSNGFCAPFRRCWWSGFFTLALLFLSGSVQANEAFKNGVAASKQSNYPVAIRYFLQAEQQGVAAASLYHNLGVAYYRTSQYDKARAAFTKVTQSSGMRALAYYNLGLVEQADGNKREARRWFAKAYDNASTSRLRQLASDQLGQVQEPPPLYKAYLEIFGGYDSNPGLVESDPSAGSAAKSEEDTVMGAVLAGRYLFSGDWQNGMGAYGALYTDIHNDLDEEDFSSASGGLMFYRKVGDWQQQYDVVVNRYWLGGGTLTDQLRGEAFFKRPLNRNYEFDVRAKLEQIRGNSAYDYDYLDGWRSEVRVRLRYWHDRWGWDAHYTNEFNDRDDRALQGYFLSASPVRHQLGGNIIRRLGQFWTLELATRYRLSEYPDDEVRLGASLGEREDKRWWNRVGLARRIGDDWTARLEWSYSDNDSNIDEFDYERDQVLFSVGRRL